jgi:NAD-dependent SIR2 family protein deacetylase
LSRHTHVWYTGAGLSIAAGLPSMSDLKSWLGVDLSVDIDPLLHTRLTHPQQVELTRMDFANKMRHSKPTPAHRALQELTGRYHMNIITENTDNLQQQTWIEPLMIGDPHLFKQTITTEHMRQIDALITIGLGSGDRGLLWYYKQSHPTGIIIAINTSCPPYLSTHDIWIPGDCQEILPTLSKD